MSQVEPQDLGLALLPPGWALTTLPELAGRTGAFTDGDWVESKDQDPEGAVRLVQLADVGDGFYRDRSNRFLSSSKASELNCTFLAAGDVLISRLADPIGRACIFPGDARPCVTVVDVALFRGAQAGGVDHIWLKNSINAQQFRSEIDQAASGTTRKRISRKNLGSLPLPLPPLNEQRRIVAKIEALQERSKAAKDALDAIPPLLEKFRQSVLAAAFRGDLTKSWRERQPEIEPATVLLDRIRAERRRRFTEANPKKKYIEPAPVDPSGLPELPAGWCWARAEEVCEWITKGTTPAHDKMFAGMGEVPFVKVYNLTMTGELDFSVEPTFVSELTHEGELARSRCYPGDVLMNIVGPPLGKVSVLPTTHAQWNINQAIAIFRPLPGILNSYIANHLLREWTVTVAKSHAKATSGRWYINHPGHAAQRRGGCQASAAKFHGSLQASGA
jgi:type I restriction enzyme S subunit